MRRRSDAFGVLLLALALASVVQAKESRICPSDPYADPRTDTCNPLRYIPSLPINLVFAILYFIVGIILTLWNFKYRANYFLCLVIGSYTEGLGLILRIVLRGNPHSTGLYIAQYLFVVLSPCAFLAGDYILLGRLVAHLDGTRYLRPFKPQLVSWIFILSDVTTFLIQAAGGGVSISDDPKTALAGSRIFLAGIAAQMASFVLFTFLWASFAYRVRFQDQVLWRRPGWKPLHWALGWTCIFFIVRSVFRTIELSQGYIGYLATHEIYVITLDTLPLLLGIVAYCYFWPGRYITPETKVASLTREEEEGDAPMSRIGRSQSQSQSYLGVDPPAGSEPSGLTTPASYHKEEPETV